MLWLEHWLEHCPTGVSWLEHLPITNTLATVGSVSVGTKQLLKRNSYWHVFLSIFFCYFQDFSYTFGLY